ncbi:TetR/AcrR family transcriptional regulator [Solimonas marina]|uniref:TetR family transcriptional regulator n=1 Tax=Solimonas marina TaxID=2714601 RepID=A0A970B5Y6_9GAMM|nr:TetR family transcriptional regulator [Solimonas marina]NKF23887.1 TetR family transcriptional regulator [Solimonas marina]
MRYATQHKEETRQRILETAAAEFRKHGVDGIGVADLMKAAGLTHGGFYAHFKSKDALFAESLARASEQTLDALRKAIETAEPGHEREAVIARYLSTQHRDRAERGCAIVALGADVSRQDAKTRRAFETRIESMIELVAAISEGSDTERRRTAIQTVATMVGALLLARSVRPSALSDEILDVARQS